MVALSELLVDPVPAALTAKSMNEIASNSQL
jgi:hypothetical protein